MFLQFAGLCRLAHLGCSFVGDQLNLANSQFFKLIGPESVHRTHYSLTNHTGSNRSVNCFSIHVTTTNSKEGESETTPCTISTHYKVHDNSTQLLLAVFLSLLNFVCIFCNTTC